MQLHGPVCFGQRSRRWPVHQCLACCPIRPCKHVLYRHSSCVGLYLEGTPASASADLELIEKRGLETTGVASWFIATAVEAAAPPSWPTTNAPREMASYGQDHRQHADCVCPANTPSSAAYSAFDRPASTRLPVADTQRAHPASPARYGRSADYHRPGRETQSRRSGRRR